MKKSNENPFFDVGVIKKRLPRNIGEPSKRKVKGFNFYLQCNEKLSKKNRKRLLDESEKHLMDVCNGLETWKGVSGDTLVKLDIPMELDSSLEDMEIMDEWNRVYEQYGGLMLDFSEQWEKEYCSNPKEVKSSNSLIQMLMDKIESLEMRLRIVESGGIKRYSF